MAKTTGLGSVSQGSSDIFKIDPRILHVKADWNVRDWALQENIDHIEQLAQSIMEVGVKQPLTVVWQDGKAWIDDGECRYRACMLAIERGAPLKTVPCRAADRFADLVERRFNRFLANTGKQFNQLELAKDFKYFVDQGWQQSDIAKRAGMSQGRVSQILDLLTMAAPIKKMVAENKISTSLAASVVKAEGSNAESVLKAGWDKALADGNTKVKPEHVGKVTLRTLILSMLDKGDIDDSDDSCCVLKVPMLEWEALKEALKY